MVKSTGNPVLIELQYLGNVSYFKKIINVSGIVYEKYEFYEKGTFRNRCYIAGANGKLRLSIPLQKGKNQHCPIKDVKISYDHNWQQLHWQSICSAYRSSPFFEYYENELYPFFHKKTSFLFDFNLRLLFKILEFLKVRPEISYTSEYIKFPENVFDCRSVILPNNKISEGMPKYRQVFEDKVGFIPNLSIIDMLFNNGPDTLPLLTK